MIAAKVRRSFGKRVRELRKQKGYSQEELADKAGLHRTYIGSIERGEQNVSIDNIDKIAKALKTPITFLFT
jgi:transcriptional regulator with XRE-family HTH domain